MLGRTEVEVVFGERLGWKERTLFLIIVGGIMFDDD
jgi:hypothetical protein